jgi:hypothetical protein
MCERRCVTLLPVTEPDAVPSDSSRSWRIKHRTDRRLPAGSRASDRWTIRDLLEPF